MKSKVLIVLALAAALSFHRHENGPACAPGGCLLLPPDFPEGVEMARAKVAALHEGREGMDRSR